MSFKEIGSLNIQWTYLINKSKTYSTSEIKHP